jgi:hypothetical protein
MKYHKYLILTGILLIFLLAGCKDLVIQDLAKSNNMEIGERYQSYSTELDDISRRYQQNYISNEEVPFELTGDVKLNQENKIILYTIELESVQENIRNVVISVLLHDTLFDRLKIPTLLFTSVDNPSAIELKPSGPDGYTSSSGYSLKGATIDSVFLDKYKDLYAKVSWISEEGVQRQVYKKIICKVEPQLLNYLQDMER